MFPRGAVFNSVIAFLPLAVLGWGQTGARPVAAQKLAPYVTSPQPIIERMLDLSGVKAGETLFDLGCGDGRIVISAAKKYGAKGVGVEMSETLVAKARAAAQTAGVGEQVKIVQDDLLKVDVSSAQVVALYLMTEANDMLAPKLARELKPGARVVSLDFQFRNWKPSKVEKIDAHHRKYTVYVYEMPQK